jgi:type II secretory pathway pseudopilin PulG
MTRTNPHQRESQAGFAMIEVTLALLVSAVVALGAMQASALARKLNFASAQGGALAIARTAGETYAQENYLALQRGAAVTKNGFTLSAGNAEGQTMRPTIGNLIQLGYLQSGFSAVSFFSNGQAPGKFRFEVERTPDRCWETGAGEQCDVSGRVYIDKPIQSAGTNEADGPAISAMAEKVGVNAGFSILPDPSRVMYLGGAGSTPNPVAGNPAGVVVARFGYGASGLSQFVRINDNRDPSLRGDFSVAGKGAFGKEVSSSESISASDIEACLRAALYKNGEIVSRATNCLVRAYLDPNTASIGVTDNGGSPSATLDGNSGRVSGALLNAATQAFPGGGCAKENDIANTQSSNAAAGILVCRGGSWRNPALVTSSSGAPCSVEGGIAVNSGNQETLVCQSGVFVPLKNFTRTSIAGSACSPETAISQTSGGSSLICQGGVWVDLVGRMGKFAFQAATMVTVSTTSQGAFVPAPSCLANGVPKIYLVPRSEEQIGYINHFATGSGPWNVYVQDGEGNPVKGIMIAQTYCYYL